METAERVPALKASHQKTYYAQRLREDSTRRARSALREGGPDRLRRLPARDGSRVDFAAASRVFVHSDCPVHAFAGSFHFVLVQLGSVVSGSGRVLCFDGMGQTVFYVF